MKMLSHVLQLISHCNREYVSNSVKITKDKDTKNYNVIYALHTVLYVKIFPESESMSTSNWEIFLHTCSGHVVAWVSIRWWTVMNLVSLCHKIWFAAKGRLSDLSLLWYVSSTPVGVGVGTSLIWAFHQTPGLLDQLDSVDTPCIPPEF